MTSTLLSTEQRSARDLADKILARLQVFRLPDGRIRILLAEPTHVGRVHDDPVYDGGDVAAYRDFTPSEWAP